MNFYKPGTKKNKKHMEYIVEKKLSLYRDETKTLYMVYMEEFIFPRFFALNSQKSMEFLSSLVFHTVTIQIIPHYHKQSLVQ